MKPKSAMPTCFSRVRMLIFLIVLAGSQELSSQSTITGDLNDEHNEPVIFANVLLLDMDSSLIKGAVTDLNGHFELNNLPAGAYIVRVAMTGLLDYYSDPVILDGNAGVKNLGILVIADDVVLMNAVEVVAKKPLFEQKIDRMIVNVANSITSSGTNALEVLERSPGVIVNRQSNSISLSGKSGVVVMINGRINYMTSDAVVRMLEGMSSENIERIEIITTPPAGFDAEGNAGYINIVLKKNLDEGFNGSYGANIGFGKGIQTGANLNFNYRKGKTNLYGDYSYAKEAQEQIFEFYRRILLDGNIVETDTRSIREPDTDNHNARLGMDYQLNPKTVIGLLISGYDTKWTMDAVNTSRISKNYIPDTLITIDNSELNQWKHGGGNINVQHTFSEGKVLRVDADILWYRDNNPTMYENIYSDGEGNFLRAEETRSRKITPINIKVGKIDYTTGLGGKMKIETGVKGTLSHFTNDVGVDFLQGSVWVPDPGLTAKYDLEEKILAAYISLEAPFVLGFNVKAGMRYEYTGSNLGSEEQPGIVDRQFGDWFPSVFFSQDFNENNSVNLAYSRRISRPTFNDMAPFVIFIDPYTFFSGNPALQPAIADNFKIGFRHKTILFSLEYSIEDSSIARFQSSIIPGTNRHLIFAENLTGLNTASMNLSMPVTPVKWWNMYYNLNTSYQVARKYFDGQLFSFEGGGLHIFSSQTITLPENFTFELSGFYGTGGLFGIDIVKPIGAVNAGLQKKFGENGGTLRVGYDDIFHTLRFRVDTDLPEQNQFFHADLLFSQPTFKISYSRNFGNQKVKAMRDRKTGSEEERGRITQ